MGRIYNNMLGTVRVEVCGAFPESFLNACAFNAIELWKLQCVDQYTLEITAYESDLPKLEALAVKCMCSIKLIETKGGSKNMIVLKKRLWLLLFVLLTGAMLFVSSLYIWEIDVYGNEHLSDSEIIRELSDCGVKEGSFWPGISAELVRSKMLTKLPDLSWMTVNISGSRAMVLIQERESKPDIYDENQGKNIVASQSGIIRKSSVMNGKSLVEVGQTVAKGQTLVSGIMESIGGDIRFVNSRAVIMADTGRVIKLVYPAETEFKNGEKLSYNRYALKFGKKRINLYLNGRNNIDECDKIITEYKLGFSSLFSLPLSLIKEKLTSCEKQSGKVFLDEEIYAQQLKGLEAGIDGSISHSSYVSYEREGMNYITIYAQCYEDIAQSVEIQ